MQEDTSLLSNSSKETFLFKLKTHLSFSYPLSKECDSPLTTEGLTNSEDSTPTDKLDLLSCRFPAPVQLDSESSSLFGHSEINTTVLGNKVRIPTNEREELYLKRAISFLSNIETGSSIDSIHSARSSPMQQPAVAPALHSSFDLNMTENSIIVPEIWITPAGTKKVSYSHLLVATEISDSDHHIQFDDCPPYLRPGPMKDLYNEQFFEKYSFLDPELTLSKIVNLREDFIIHICKILRIEACTIALAWSYFERLTNKNFITKSNRKLYGGCCLLLAYKFNEETHLEKAKHKLRKLMRAIYALDKNDILTPQDLIHAEFKVYAALDFSLLRDVSEFSNGFLHVLSRLDTTPLKYLKKSYYNSGMFSD
jgi:hypothetical protein